MSSTFLLLLLTFGQMLFPTPTLYDFSVNTIDGSATKLDTYNGKVVLVVNVASMCGHTPQYEQLQQLHETYADRGLVILGFPANDFGAQEPGSNAEIKEFCTSNFGVTFPMFEKISVKGPATHPLYSWLVAGGGQSTFAGDIPWNFEKFLIDRDGQVINRFNYRVKPDDAAVVSAIEAALM
jgi:glutathione peroxidase